MTRNNWLHRLPPWRAPRVRTHHYHHGHHTERIPPIRWALVAYLFTIVWWLELNAWLITWCYYGLFLALRWCWRHNPIGRTHDAVAAHRKQQQPAPYDPHRAPPQHYDLGELGRR